MASIGKDGNGCKRILFVAEDGSRRTVRLGKCSLRQAEAFKVKLEALVAGRFSGHDLETARWLAGLPDDMHARLAAVGLVDLRAKQEPEAQMSIGRLCDQYIDSRTDVRKNTCAVYDQTRRNLVDFFGYDKAIGAINEHDAEEWRRYLTREKLAEATARKRCAVAKQFFRCAIKQKLITSNPFAELKSTAVGNTERQYSVSRQEAQKVLDACP